MPNPDDVLVTPPDSVGGWPGGWPGGGGISEPGSGGIGSFPNDPDEARRLIQYRLARNRAREEIAGQYGEGSRELRVFDLIYDVARYEDEKFPAHRQVSAQDRALVEAIKAQMGGGSLMELTEQIASGDLSVSDFLGATLPTGDTIDPPATDDDPPLGTGDTIDPPATDDDPPLVTGDAIDLDDVFNIPGIEDVAGYGGEGDISDPDWGEIDPDQQVRLPSGDFMDLGDIWPLIGGFGGSGGNDGGGGYPTEYPDEAPPGSDPTSTDVPNYGDGGTATGDGGSVGDSAEGDGSNNDGLPTDIPLPPGWPGSEEEMADFDIVDWAKDFFGDIDITDIMAMTNNVVAGYVGAEAGKDAAEISAAAMEQQGIRQDKLARDIMSTGITYGNEQRDIALASTEPYRNAGAIALAGMMDMSGLDRSGLTASENQAGTGTGGATASGGDSMYEAEFDYDLDRVNDPSRLLAETERYDWQTDPGYQFRLGETMRGLERSFNAAGGTKSGAYDRALMETSGEFASAEFGKVYNRLAGIAGFGQASPGQGAGGDSGISSAGNSIIESANAIGAAGSARAAGQIASGQSWMDAAHSFTGYLGGRNA